MHTLFFFALCYNHAFHVHRLHRQHDLPLLNMRYSKESYEYDCKWEAISDTKHRVMLKYFGKSIKEYEDCELFCIEGVPAASMIYNQTNRHGDPCVSAFFFNKGLLFLFDATQNMRHTLFKRYRNIDIQYAENRNDFLLM